MNTSELFERSKKDLEHIFKCFSTQRFEKNKNFSSSINKDIEKNIIAEKKLENTKNIMNVQHWGEIKIKKMLSNLLSMKIKCTGNSYWLVNEEKSAIPGKVDKDKIVENSSIVYRLIYRLDGENLKLIKVEDNYGLELGRKKQFSITRDPIIKLELVIAAFSFLIGTVTVILTPNLPWDSARILGSSIFIIIVPFICLAIYYFRQK
ncbi:hypothetical protein GF354_06440 [Candidatus Peregrinibacteria bacterium]|nr:hypothetical protein [Candidatus Peregrinibacteria bacterium]